MNDGSEMVGNEEDDATIQAPSAMGDSEVMIIPQDTSAFPALPARGGKREC